MFMMVSRTSTACRLGRGRDRSYNTCFDLKFPPAFGAIPLPLLVSEEPAAVSAEDVGPGLNR